MNFLSELEGLSGENLCSAALRLLLIRSQELREGFVDVISRRNRKGPIMLDSHFSCTLEEPTEESGRWGRLDLLLEVDDAVIGVENKLNAGFQKDQPRKYLDTVLQRAGALQGIRGKDYKGIVAVLAPESRNEEIEKVVSRDDRLLGLTWEEILDDFKRSEEVLDPGTKVLLRSLDSYMRQQITLFPDWKRWMPHLCEKFVSKGTAYQRKVVGKVWQFFPDAGVRLSFGDTWCGYWFADGSRDTKGWYGFVSKKEIIQGAKNNAEFIIAVPFEVPLPKKFFREIQLKDGPKFIEASWIHSWAIELDDSWGQPYAWRQRLQPLVDAYDRIVNKGRSGNP